MLDDKINLKRLTDVINKDVVKYNAVGDEEEEEEEEDNSSESTFESTTQVSS